ncbi:MAG: CHASE3 domain-containing protein [Kaiparowitsia implicata GSE-PSE-MK54-09C]|jgi:PAS domain S-box-containing protein|nr:CHASE3 domain-containing protein [Kaiparowitsia implicata GSE-PSE-MK54-09C]
MKYGSAPSLLAKLSSYWYKMPIRYRGAAIISIPTLCLMVTLGTWLWGRFNLVALRGEIENKQELISLSDSVLRQTLAAESSVLGYALTKDEAFIDPYKQAVLEAQSEVRKLQEASRGSLEGEAQIRIIERLAQRQIETLERTVNNASNEGRFVVRSPQTLALVNRGKAQMINFISTVNDFQAENRAILNGLGSRRRWLQEITGRMLSLVTVVSLLSSAAAVYLFSQLDQELKERERLLLENRNLLTGIVSNVVDGVMVLNEFGEIEMINPTAIRMFGYEPYEVIGKDIGLLLVDLQSNANEAELAAMPNDATGYLSSRKIEPGRPWQALGVRKDESSFPIEVSMSDMQLDRRNIVIMRDITPFLDTEAKLQNRADELARLSSILAHTNTALEDRNRELEQFAYVASHDLKAPLRAIANLSEWIEEDLNTLLPKENKHQMTLLRGRVHRMEALINGLLEYSRVGRTESPIEQVSVRPLLSEVIDSLAPPPTFALQIEESMPTLMARRVPLRQVFANLLSNAIKHHNREDGKIWVSAEECGDCYRFTVADDGPGIAPEFHIKIFTIFQTLQPRDAKENTGIGLSIVKKIVEREGGTITVESEEQQGAQFRFTWPKYAVEHSTLF